MPRRPFRVLLPLLIVVLALALGLLAWRKPRPEPLPPPGIPPQPPPGVQVLRDLEYARTPSRPLRLDLYLPPEPRVNRPLVIWIHGGAWRGLDKNACPVLYLTQRGYALASIDYRLSQEAIFPAQIQDCKAAVRWLRANASRWNIDPNRIGVWGFSAGGHLAAMLGTSEGVSELDGDEGNPASSSAVQAVCDCSGPTDLLQMAAHLPAGSAANPDSQWSPQSRLIGGPLQENRDRARLANPITYVTPNAPPFLILHGKADDEVPAHQSQLLADALKAANVPAQLILIDGVRHQFDLTPWHETVAAFFDKHLRRP